MKVKFFYLCLLGLAFGCSSPSKRPGSKAEKPNVLFIVSDDLRTEIGTYGYDYMKTPNIDNLASQGRLFKEAHVQQAICNPSRMSFLTGLLPDETKVYGNKDHFRSRRPDATTIPQHFKENGYRTQSIGKVFHGGMNDPFAWSVPPVKISHPRYGSEVQAREDSAKAAMAAKGTLQTRYLELDSAGLPIRQIRTKGEEFHEVSWESVDQDPYYFSDGKNVKYAMQTLDTLSETREPFFLAVGLARPHLPYVAPKRFFELYEKDELDPEIQNLPIGASYFAFNGMNEVLEYSDVNTVDQMTLKKQQTLRKAYRACVSYVDFLIGDLLKKLKETGLAENTIVVLVGDHGYHLGEQGNWGKSTNFDWGTRAPLILKIPDQKQPGKAAGTFVEFIDLLPTLSELASLPEPFPTNGKSFVSTLHDPTQKHKSYAFSQYPRRRNGVSAMGYTVRGKDWRYTQWINRKTGEVVTDELYDLRENEIELKNVAGEAAYQDIQKILVDQLEHKYRLSSENLVSRR